MLRFSKPQFTVPQCPLSLIRKSLQPYLANSDRACLAIKEASLSGKSASLSSSIRDSEGTRLAPWGEQPEVEGRRLELALEAELKPEAVSELELEPVAELELAGPGPVSEDLQA